MIRYIFILILSLSLPLSLSHAHTHTHRDTFLLLIKFSRVKDMSDGDRKMTPSVSLQSFSWTVTQTEWGALFLPCCALRFSQPNFFISVGKDSRMAYSLKSLS